MKRKYIDKKFGEPTMAIIGQVNRILEEYESQGYDLSLRQLYYRFIAADLFPQSWIDEAYNRKNGLDLTTKNTEKNYKNLGGIVSDARLAGLVDWEMIVDRGREAVSNSHWDTPGHIVEACARQFQIDKWADQRNYVEVMVEKQALEGVLLPVCQELDVTFTANKGYSSSSAMYEAGRRFYDAMREDKQPYVIYLGDHDPSGIDMTRDILDRLRMFTHYTDGDEQAVQVRRVALNLDQVRRLRPPENPAKVTDSRAAAYIDRFGMSSWELDAIEPRQLANLVRDAVVSLRDDACWKATMDREQEMRDTLVKIAQKLKA